MTISSSSSTPKNIPNCWRDVERVIVLNKMIEEVDIYSKAPSPNKWVEYFDCGGFCFPRSQFASVFDTSQLQFLLSLEKELDVELLKPLEYSVDEGRLSGDSTVTLQLQKRIYELDIETDYILDLENRECCSTKYAIPMSTNLLLLKRILEIRLAREKRNEKTAKNGFTYGSISKPSINFSHDTVAHNGEEEFQKKLEKWSKELSTLKSANPFGRTLGKNSILSYLQFTYKTIKEQDLKSKIKPNTPVVETDPPPYSN